MPNLTVVTADNLDQSLAQLWSAMKTYVSENIDTSEIMTTIKGYLDEANRETIGTTASEKAEAVRNSIDAIVSMLYNAGVDTTNLHTQDLAALIASMLPTGSEVCLLDSTGRHWTVAEWEIYKEEHGHAPDASTVVAVITPYNSFVIAPNFDSKVWGNISDTVPGLPPSQTASFINILRNNAVFSSLDGTRMMLMWYDPEVLGEEWYTRVPTYADLLEIGAGLMYDEQIYIVTSDENTLDGNNEPTANMAYVWTGTEWQKRFPVPRSRDNIIGSPAAKSAWQFKMSADDTRQWALPVINQMLIMYVHEQQINECLYAINLSGLPSGYSWTCQQVNVNGAYYVAIPSGQVNYNIKNGACAVVRVAAL